MARKIYTPELKEPAVKLSYSSGKPVAETAADLGLAANMLHRWRREAKRAGRAFPGHGKARDEEMAALKK
jgi:transposase